jgi:hypothetical protein
VAAAAIVGACTDVNTGPTTVASLEFDTLPYPSIVTGDTLRDSLGRAAPLHAVVYNGSGAIIANPSVQYIAFDTGVTIGAGGIVTAQARSGSVRIIASSGGLQSKPLTVLITRRPDSVVATGKLVDTLRYTVPDTASSNVYTGFGLKLATTDTDGGVSGTVGWLVSYQLFLNGVPVARSDTTVASLWSAASQNPSLLDTTTTGGTSSRRLRVRSLLLKTTLESLTVIATTRYRGTAIRGSPVRFVLYLLPK